jgi:glutamyl-tRNA reductase
LNFTDKNTFLIGVNHDTAPLEVRERLVFDAGVLPRSYYDLKNRLELDETLILSTCNRTEIYFCCDDFAPVVKWLAKEKGIPEDLLASYLHILRSAQDVLKHASRLASGMESMVIGETQIFGQMKVAYQHADAANCLGKMLRKIFDLSFSIAKEVRTNTAIGLHSVSLASSALRAAERIFPNFREAAVLFIGAGEMIDLFGQHFAAKKFKSLSFANRTVANASALAAKYGGKIIDLGDLAGSLSQFDIIISCTASPIPILGKGAFEDALRRRRHNPMAVFDLAVPRDVERSVSDLDDVFVFTVDDLGELVRQSFGVRQSALDEASKIIATRVDDFVRSSEPDGSVEAVKLFRGFGDALVREEQDKCMAALRRGEDPEIVMRRLSTSLGKKFMDRPSRKLREAKVGGRAALGQALLNLFDLDDSA